jgi:competence protein ComEC
MRKAVLQIRSGGRSVLLPGDIESPQEFKLLARAATEGSPVDLRSEVLLVPHHGSLTSSSEAFLDAVRPRLALIQAGYRNRFGHPRPQVVQRYLDRGIRIERNDQGGAITVVLDERGIKTEVYREAHRRYWYGR